MKYNVPELKGKYYSCYSLKMMEELDRLGIEPIEEFVHIETKKHCQIYKMTDELCKFLTEWSTNKNNLKTS